MPQLQLDRAQLAALCPTYVRLDLGGRISGLGPSVTRLIPEAEVGLPFWDVFDATPPFDLAERADSHLVVTFHGRSNRLHMRGLVLSIPCGHLVFARPALEASAGRDGVSLRVGDFSPVDGAVSILLSLGVRDDLLKEIDELVAAHEQRLRENRILYDELATQAAALARSDASRQKADARYRQHFDHSIDGILITDRDWILDANPSLCRILGYAREEMVGRRAEAFSLKTDDGVPATVAAGAAGATSIEGRARLKARNGQEFSVEYTTTPTPDGNAMTIIRDVTERERTEAALRETRAQLARFARISTLGEMVATISHEINQPLAAVASNGDAALRWLAKSPPNLDEVETALTRIVRDAHRANAVIRRTRALFARGDAAYSEVDLNDAVTEVVSLTAGEIRSAGVIAELYLANDLPRVRGDRIQLQQVLLNLILNARDAMTGVSDHRARLKIVTEIAADGGVLVSVEDAGVGLEASMIDRVFDRFVTTKVDGTGMGLAICKTIIEAHGGRIWASPGPTFGAVLRFTLPPLGAISA